MGPFTLICSDLDGTLLDNSSRISLYSAEMIARARAEGAIFCLTSGRPPAMMAAYQARLGLDSPLIANNGAIVWLPQAGVCLHRRPIPPAPALDFLSFCQRSGLDWAVFTQESIYTPGSPARLRRYGEYNALAKAQGVQPIRVHTATVETAVQILLTQCGLRISVVFRDGREELLLQEYFSQPRGLTHVHSTPESYDVLAPGVNKGDGILAVSRYYGIPEERICVFGNDINDMEMVARARTAFAVSNAERPLLDLAPIVIESNQDEGVAHAIRRYILGNIVPPPKNRQKGERP